MINDIQIDTNFKLYEFQSPDTQTVMLDPELLGRLQNVRDRLARPVNVASGYRTPAHNAAVGGAPGSFHMKGMAADITVKGITIDQLADTCKQAGFRGVIIYRGDGHVHVDTRPNQYYAEG